MKFTKDHEWLKIEGDTAIIGITQFAADALGELVYVELPKIGSNYKKHSSFAVVESSKSASDVYIPLSGDIIAINENLNSSPELVNQSPYQEGWIAKIKITNINELEDVMTEEEYSQFIQNQ
jgi:glycine cleavage system H protein